MPSIKPDPSAIKSTRARRGLWDRPDDVFQGFRRYAETAIEGGTIDYQRAADLLWHIGLRTDMHFFPYSEVRNLLAYAVNSGEWSADLEHDLLVVLTGLLDNETDFNQLLREPLKTRKPLYHDIFDIPRAPLFFMGRLCDFTGAFKDRPRRTLYEQVQQLGGTPSDGGWYTDYFFVADDHADKLTVSNGLAGALHSRMRYGHTRIYRERDFPNSQ